MKRRMHKMALAVPGAGTDGFEFTFRAHTTLSSQDASMFTRSLVKTSARAGHFGLVVWPTGKEAKVPELRLGR